MIVTTTNSVRRLNLNQRRFGLASVIFDSPAAQLCATDSTERFRILAIVLRFG